MKQDKLFFKWAKNIFIYERDLGWTSNFVDEAIANGYEDPYIFAVKVFPTNVKFIYKERFFVIEKELACTSSLKNYSTRYSSI